MKIIICLFFILFQTNIFAEIKVKVKPLEFKEIRTRSIGEYKSKAKARGIIIITTDNLQEDIGKLIKIEVPKYINMSNGKRWIKTENIIFVDDNQEKIISHETEKMIYYVILDKKELTNTKEKNTIEGEYIGELPINYSIYSRGE